MSSEEHISKLYRQLSRYEFYLEQYDEPLRRYRNEQREIKNALIETYPHFWHSEEDDDAAWRMPPPRPVVERWTPDRARIRPAIRDSLDHLNSKWAPEIEKHKKLKAIVRGMRAELKSLVKTAQKAHKH